MTVGMIMGGQVTEAADDNPEFEEKTGPEVDMVGHGHSERKGETGSETAILM